MAQIELSNGGHALVSDDDVHTVNSAGAWFSVRKGSVHYVCRSFGQNNRVYLHRYLTKAPVGTVVDHINGDGLDNRRENLRLVSVVENIRNRGGAQRNSKSGVRGIYWHKQRGKWCAAIRHFGKNISLGLFNDLESAQKARQSAEEKLWSPADRYRSLMLSARPKVD